MKTLNDLVSSRRRQAVSIEEFPLAVGARVRRQRIAFDLRQSDLAKQAGVSVQTIKSAEKGEAISYESLLRVLLALGHGGDFLQMLDSPNFPHLRAHERFLELKTSAAPDLKIKRVRPKP
ncbi:helix-turn-helix domain-containing protein [Frateuria sp. Soil773]|uniref:helix-turn-helix domain-containing protein n=1 Tax=Frateuria sp. Soil773 TaxID=1736407 RepID=UPI0009E7904B|nr:helix-turn-helix domain-containing protein [Frateuria sp. Soil773]